MDELLNILVRHPDWTSEVRFDETVKAYAVSFRTLVTTKEGDKSVQQDRAISIRALADCMNSRDFLRDELRQLEQTFVFNLDNLRARLKSEEKI